MSDKKRNDDIRKEMRPADYDEQLESFLDGTLEASQRSAYLAEHEGAKLDDAMKQNTEIEASLKRLFQAGEAPQKHVEEVAQQLQQLPVTGVKRPLSTMPVALIALAASLAFVGISIWWFFGSTGQPDPFFQPTALVKLYDEAIENGFEPYYECKDDQRFRDVFSERQGVGLALAPLPVGMRMLGLSYPGGLSRNTTAMLCEIDGQPAMVFVDREGTDMPEVGNIEAQRNLHIHKQTKNGLVFYEVTPFAESRITEYLVLAKDE